MKVVILAGGFGTRLSEYTDLIPKPMVLIGGRPMLWHVMQIYAKHGHKDFYIALGYKSEKIKEFFLNYRAINSDFTIDLEGGDIKYHQLGKVDWRVTLIDTGEETMTGGRVRRIEKFIGNEPFMLTYGDGLANINIDSLLKFHKSHGKMVTVSATRPVARFGELGINGDKVESFKEKPQITEGWINGGFFVIQPDFFQLLDGDDAVLEGSPLVKAADLGELMAFRHNGFWHCMDTKRDRDNLEALWKSGAAPWTK